ncbi:MAG: ATP-dependent Clp protease ATP-binding subunit, partial [Bacteroidales bacterium]|nr:ATP-dependent Clp protease ATP-binding subunit [Bacteroidales bacterium]MBN2634165.1 ATP-dependent Clp protease ATP-binding subunit [Bacteroidales bacterium]
AHPDVFHILLQVLDEGQLTDSLGRRIDFRNTIVILTSNIGTRQIAEFGHGIGFDTQARKTTRDEQSKSILQKALQKTFAPEFLNRIDDVIMFNSLGREEINQIIDLELKGLYERVAGLGFQLKIAPAARDFIAEKGFDANFGARPLKRAIQKYLEDPMAEILIKAGPGDVDIIKVGFNAAKSEIKISFSKKKDDTDTEEDDQSE